MTQDEMAGWHHRVDGHEFEWTPGVGDGQGRLAYYNSWGYKESDTTEQLNWTEWKIVFFSWIIVTIVIPTYNAHLSNYPKFYKENKGRNFRGNIHHNFLIQYGRADDQ